MIRKILLLACILILISGSLSCKGQEVSVTVEKTQTETVTAIKTATDTETVIETETVTISETQTVTVTATPIRVKRVRHGHGEIVTLDLETEYLPVVVASENHDAPYESLKAQAIASRTFGLFKILREPRSTDYDILDYSADQEYDPDAVAGLPKSEQDLIRQAVIETRGLVLKYAGSIICSSYVSGNPQTLQYVTFNQGKSGDSITQTSLISKTNPPSLSPYNRGCMGQIQANELAQNGYNWEQILRYFYGADINIEKFRPDIQ